MAGRSPEEIRRSIEETRQELTFSLTDLQGKVTEMTNWRRQLGQHRVPAMIGAGVTGFLVGGGIAATVNLVKGD